jgi:hypothetical protein
MKLCGYLALAVMALGVPAVVSGQLTSTEQNALKGPTPYFTTKMENLTTQLNLSTEQQAKLKPIVEQEVGMLGGIRGQSGLTQKQKIARLEQIVAESDKQMKPWLSAEQWQKLQAMRKDQKTRLKEYAK